MTNSDSPVLDFYPTDFSTDLNGKQHEWESVVLIPFIDEVCILLWRVEVQVLLVLTLNLKHLI